MRVDNFKKQDVDKKFDQIFSDFDTGVHGTLNMVVIGVVSAGKSSFLNAFFDAPREAPIFKTGAESGITKATQIRKIGKHINVIDTPGLQDIEEERSNITVRTLEEGIDLGILILEGSASLEQLKIYESLKDVCTKTYIVFNKIDQEADEINSDTIDQWQRVLSLKPGDLIYPVSSRGYDKKDRIKDPVTSEEREIPVDGFGVPLTLRGIKEIREDIMVDFFKTGKSVFIARELNNKRKAALAIIAAACTSAAASAYLPGSIALIAGTQVTAISSLLYLYHGQIATKERILLITGQFATTAFGSTLFLGFVSFLPPNGIFDTAGAVVAIAVTAAMLITTDQYLRRGKKLVLNEEAKARFNQVQQDIRKRILHTDVKELTKKKYWKNIIESYLKED